MTVSSSTAPRNVVPAPDSRINNFVIKFANPNGTGSASANQMFATAIFRMGVPISPKNIFPSNIQGQPTWYEIRISEQGYLGRREGVDVMMSVNPQTQAQDVQAVLPGGYFVYDNSKPLDRRLTRPDIRYIGLPLTDICLREFADPRLRQLLKNITYVGALCALLGIEFTLLTDLIAEQFKSKEQVIKQNIHALKQGYQYASAAFDCPLEVRVERRTLIGDRILMTGNAATGLGAVYGGATVAAWYPITPSTSVVDAFENYASRLRVDPGSGKKYYAIAQAEDELSALGMVIGASWNGARAFTATSGPGISLMSEFLGLAYYAEVPVVLFNVQRAGPSTGLPTRTQQADLLACAYASHGDTKHVLLFPASPRECFDFAADALDLAERLQTPVIVMLDLDLGMNHHLCQPLVWDDERQYDRGKVLGAEALEEGIAYGRYQDVDGDGIGYRTIPGMHPSRGACLTRGTAHDAQARYTEASEPYVANMDRLVRKFDNAVNYLPPAESFPGASGGEFGVLFFGTSTDATLEAMDTLADEGVAMDGLRIRAFPFTADVEPFIASHQVVFVIEQNRDGQLRSLLLNELQVDPHKLISVLNYDGLPITADFIREQISQCPILAEQRSPAIRA